MSEVNLTMLQLKFKVPINQVEVVSMYSFSNKNLEKAISGITAKLGIPLDKNLQKEYQDGKHPTLLSYEKVEKASIQIPVIQKYMIGAQTNLNQPCNYYDIFRLCRHVILIQILDTALTTILKKTKNFEPRLDRLCREREYDDFESVLYEIVVAANYCLCAEIKDVEFLPEESVLSPDLGILTNAGEAFVECKKFDRSVDISHGLRNIVRNKVQVVIHTFRKMGKSAVLDISFHKHPDSVSDDKIENLSIESLKVGTPIIDPDITVSVSPLSYEKLDTYTLYPSPKYFWERYKYRERGEWFGIVLSMYAKRARHINTINLPEELMSTWLDDVEWECAVKWKITDHKILWQHKRLGYDLLFKGLSQLQSESTNTVLHTWFERDYAIGHRQNEMLDFFGRIKSAARDIFAWIIFNETCFDVSPEGRYDLIENAHIVRGPGALSSSPMVTCVFTQPDERTRKLAEFGIGHEMPDIDQLFK